MQHSQPAVQSHEQTAHLPQTLSVQQAPADFAAESDRAVVLPRVTSVPVEPWSPAAQQADFPDDFTEFATDFAA